MRVWSEGPLPWELLEAVQKAMPRPLFLCLVSRLCREMFFPKNMSTLLLVVPRKGLHHFGVYLEVPLFGETTKMFLSFAGGLCQANTDSDAGCWHSFVKAIGCTDVSYSLNSFKRDCIGFKAKV